MIKVETKCNDETITWQVEMTYAQRREIHRQECVFLTRIGEQDTLVIQSHPLLNILLPEAVAADGIADEDFEEWFWALPQMHIESLATQVGSYVYTGIAPADQGSTDRPEAVDGDAAPLPSGTTPPN